MGVMKDRKWFWLLFSVFTIVILLCILAIYFILKTYNLTKDTIEFEIVKSLLQILTVLILGQIISLVVAQYNLNHQKNEARTEFRKNIRHRLTQAYITIIKHRRLFRAKGLTKPYAGVIQTGTNVRLEAYEEQMKIINETEAEIKAIRTDIKSSGDIFSSSDSLIEKIGKMDDYLRRLIKIYEQKLGAFDGEPATLPLAEMKISDNKSHFKLEDFVGKTGNNRFDKEFIEPYDAALKLIIADILNLRHTEKSLLESEK